MGKVQDDSQGSAWNQQMQKGNAREYRQEEESQVWREDDDLSLGLTETEGWCLGEIWTQESEQRSLAQG